MTSSGCLSTRFRGRRPRRCGHSYARSRAKSPFSTSEFFGFIGRSRSGRLRGRHFLFAVHYATCSRRSPRQKTALPALYSLHPPSKLLFVRHISTDRRVRDPKISLPMPWPQLQQPHAFRRSLKFSLNPSCSSPEGIFRPVPRRAILVIPPPQLSERIISDETRIFNRTLLRFFWR